MKKEKDCIPYLGRTSMIKGKKHFKGMWHHWQEFFVISIRVLFPNYLVLIFNEIQFYQILFWYIWNSMLQ